MNEPFSNDPLISKVDYKLSKDRSVVRTKSGRVENLGSFKNRRDIIMNAQKKSNYGQSSKDLMNLYQDYRGADDQILVGIDGPSVIDPSQMNVITTHEPI